MFNANDNQQPPVVNDLPNIYELVMIDVASRADAGEKKYGVRLQAGNGRDALLDAYQEVLDLAQYLRQRLYEEHGE